MAASGVRRGRPTGQPRHRRVKVSVWRACGRLSPTLPSPPPPPITNPTHPNPHSHQRLCACQMRFHVGAPVCWGGARASARECVWGEGMHHMRGSQRACASVGGPHIHNCLVTVCHVSRARTSIENPQISMVCRDECCRDERLVAQQVHTLRR